MKTNRKKNKDLPAHPPARERMLEKVFLKAWRPYYWLLALGALVYSQTLSFNYTQLDDTHLIIQNQQKIGDLGNLPTAFRTDVFLKSPGAYYRPLFTASLMLDAARGGATPFAYHLTNLLLHLLSAIMVFIVLNALGYQRRLSLLFSAIFSVHPALAQAVSWIPGRNDILLMLFTLISFWSLLKIRDTRRWTWFFVHVVSLAAALFTKETALIMPVIYLSYLAIAGRQKIPVKFVLSLAAGWVITAAAYLLMRQWAIHPVLSDISCDSFPEIATGLISYIGKMAVPVNLSVYPVARDIPLAAGIVAVIALGLLWLVLGVADRRRFWFGLAWSLLFLLPTIIRSEGYAVFLEHRLYVPLFGSIIMLLESRIMKHNAAPLIVVAIIALFSIQTIRHSAAFASDRAFWGNAAATAPSSYLAHRMMGKLKAQNGEYETAKAEYQKALSFNPDDFNTINELGGVYFCTGDMPEAETLLMHAASLAPSNVIAQKNLGYFYLNNNRPRQARQYFGRGLQLSPANASLHNGLAMAFLDEKKYDSACYHYDLARQYGSEQNQAIEAILKPYRAGRRQ